jgi:predicted acyl esterase
MIEVHRVKSFQPKLIFALLMVSTQITQSCVSVKDAGYGVRAEPGIMIEMRDGAKLATDLYFPEGATGKLPAVLLRTIYVKEREFGSYPLFAELIRRGYVVAIQDTRGRAEPGTSDVRPSVGDRNDAYDTVSWLTNQPWSNQKVGSAGCSSPGEAQLLLAATRHPHHVTAIPQSSASGYNIRGRPWASFDGGVFELAQTAGWFSGDPSRIDFATLPIIDVLKKAGLPPSEYENFASSNPDGEYFRSLEWIRPGDQLDLPMLFFDSWYDFGPAETLELFNVLRAESASALARENQFVIIAPVTHCGYRDLTEDTVVGERELGDARLDVMDLRLRWYDYWLKGIDNGITDMPRVQYYVMGRNAWQSANAWPVPGTRFEKLYLHSNGKANSRNGDGTLSIKPPAVATSDTFIYDPGSPVPSLGGHTCCTGTDTESGGYDQSEIELRDDVLVYTSAVLDEGIEVTGPLEVILQVSSSAADTDFTAKLVDVYPDGRAFNVEEGALRLRYREGFDKNLRMRPDETYRIRLDLHVTSNYFGPGHRIRLEVSSSNFPRWDRNLNTGGNNYDEAEYVSAENTVHHSKDRPSYILLPIVN